ncbi:hypothetical protein JCGZ_14976 [Jatropha curcas]|uniref:Uncharacterized protein n=1 Tax=Jatropha curcas TaxID=180498 RepID=A0A067KIW6_JATCU|nr:hypothetical protein JCGZ_14976 [Jatropha curcas]
MVKNPYLLPHTTDPFRPLLFFSLLFCRCSIATKTTAAPRHYRTLEIDAADYFRTV